MTKSEVRTRKSEVRAATRSGYGSTSHFPPPTSHFRRRPAFTLIEAITTLVIIALIGTAASRILFQAFQALDNASTRTDLANTVASAMERVAGEIRTMEIKSGSSPATPDITACTASSITFKNTSAATRTISLSGSTIVITGSAATTQSIASGVTAFTIQTYDSSNTALPASPSAAQIDTIRRIQITITASVTNTSGTISETLRTKVYLRCMGLGSGSS
jgi:type II secretory pathway pseudopilin PulG